MGISEILASIDREIAHLKQARALLTGDTAAPGKKAAGSRKAAAAKEAKRAKKRVLTPEGRRRIAEAQKQRWAAQKKAAAAGQK